MGRPLFVVAAMLVAGLVVIHTAVRSDAVPPGQPGVIAFSSDRGGDFDIWTVDPSSGTVDKLFDTSEDERYPAWSPDGTKIAFVRKKVTSPCSASSACEELWVRVVATGTETLIVPGVVNGFMYTPAWSPDGAKLAYVSRDSVNYRDVWVVSSSGGTPTRVTSSSSSELSPDWSPDGSTLVFSISGALYTVSASATNGSPVPAVLTLSGTAPAHAREPSWAPDGRIVFFGGPSSFTLPTLYVTSSDGSGTEAVWNGGTATLSNPGWASDAGNVAFALYPSSGAKADLRIWDPCTGEATAIAASDADDLDPVWRPTLPAPSTMPPACPSSPPTTTPPPTSPTTTSSSASGTSSATSTTSSATSSATSASSSSMTSTATTTSTATSASSSPPPTPPPGTIVAVDEAAIDPSAVRIRRGGTIVWDNVGSSTQHVIDGTGLALFDLLLEPAGFGTHRFVAAGRYRYANAGDASVDGTVSVPLTASPAKGSRRTIFDVTWASQNAPAGYAYDVQIRRPGGKWRPWKDDLTRTGAPFVADAGAGTYRFRARMVRLADASHARWSVDDAIRVGS